METDELWRTIHGQRSALADILGTLSPQDWEHASLCPDWTVRDVAAHVISSAGFSTGEALVGVLRARGNFNRLMFNEAKRLSARPTDEIIADYRRLDGSRRHPPGTTTVDPLMDVLVHTQDIVRPLGRHHEMPARPSAVAADQVWSRSFPFRARRRLGGYRLAATDIDWAVGDGPEINGSMGALLLLLTGRAVGAPELSGDGIERLTLERNGS
jgi:uncharacterized protein (TIGR03083 family)